MLLRFRDLSTTDCLSPSLQHAGHGIPWTHPGHFSSLDIFWMFLFLIFLAVLIFLLSLLPGVKWRYDGCACIIYVSPTAYT